MLRERIENIMFKRHNLTQIKVHTLAILIVPGARFITLTITAEPSANCARQ